MKLKLFLFALFIACTQHLLGQPEGAGYRRYAAVEQTETTKIDNASLYDFLKWYGCTMQETEDGYIFFDSGGMGCLAKVIECSDPCNRVYIKMCWYAGNRDRQILRQVVQDSAQCFRTIDAEVADSGEHGIVMASIEPFVPSVEYFRIAFEEYIDHLESYMEFIANRYDDWSDTGAE